MKAMTKVLVDHKGNRCVIPSMIIRPDMPDQRTKYDVGQEAFTLDMMIGTTREESWFEFDDEAFPHVVTTLIHPGFLHGGCTAYVFAGPLFDQISAEVAGA